jgi:AcrR family transcriptional regulator
MARPRASEQRNTRGDILDAALELFASKGFFGTSLRDIARAVGVRESALYHHFPSKEALFEAVLMPDALAGEMPLRCLPLPTTRAAVQPYFEKLAVQLLERFLTLKERKRFRMMLIDGIRLAGEGRINYWEKMGAQRQVLHAAIADLQAQGLLRPGDPQLLMVSFVAPILLLRQMVILQPEHPFVTGFKAFAASHAEQFSRGALALD